MRPTDRVRRTLWSAELLLAGIAVVVAVATGTAATLTRPVTAHDPQLDGLVIAVAVLLVCWVLLGVGAAWWGRRLDEIDRMSWAADWARVEPTWSGRS